MKGISDGGREPRPRMSGAAADAWLQDPTPSSVAYVARVLGHDSPSITLSTYAHLFEQAAHADRTREAMEAAFGEVLR